MPTSLQLTGWWRLWVFLTTIWLIAVGAITYSTWPSEEQAAHHPAFIYQLDIGHREALASEGATSIGVAVDMPNGYRLRFKPGVDESAYTPIARAYQQIAVKAQAEARRNNFHQSALVALLPPIFLALLGMGVAWVRQGFKAAHR